MQKINILNKDFYYIDSDDPVVQSLKYGHLFGYQNYLLSNHYSKKDSGWIIDCGAHIGTFSFVPAVQDKNILLIEGAKENCLCLESTFKNMNNIIIENAIVLDTIRNCNFNSLHGPFGSVVLDDKGTQNTNTIDNICNKYHINDVSIIKYDIEGFEEDALIGSSNIIKNNKPLMLIEVNGHCLKLRNKKPSDIFAVLDSYNYYYFIPHEDQLISIDKSAPFPFCVIDIIAIHKDNIYKYIGNTNLLSSMKIDNIKQVLEHNKIQANQDCTNYYNSIEI